MTAKVLHLTHETREAVLDLRAVQKAIRDTGRGSSVLADASRIVVAHARGEEPKPESILAVDLARLEFQEAST